MEHLLVLFFIICNRNFAVAMMTEYKSKLTLFANNGDTVILECYTTRDELFNLSVWRRGEHSIFVGTSFNPNYPRGDRFSITGRRENGEYFMRISNITEDDFGNYKCETVTDKGVVFQEVTLSLRSTETYRQTTFQTDRRTKEVTTRREGYETENTLDHTYTVYHTSSGYDEEEIPKPVSGLALNWTLVFSGLIGACFVLVIVLSVLGAVCIYKKYKTTIVRVPNEHNFVVRYHEHDQNSRDTSAYEYIDEDTMVHQHVQLGRSHEVPVHSGVIEGRLSNVSSRQSYFEFLGDTAEIRHSYESLIEKENNEAPHHYMAIHKHTMSRREILSPNCKNERKNRSNSLGMPRNINSESGKRAHSWPQNSDSTHNKYGLAAYDQQVRKPKENNQEIKQGKATSDYVYVDKCLSGDTKININIKSALHNMTYTGDTSLTALGQMKANIDEKKSNQTETKGNYGEEHLRQSSVKHSDENILKIDNLSNSLYLSEPDSSSDNESDKQGNVTDSTATGGPYADLSTNNLDSVHDYSICSASLNFNIV